jgi:hypothetical protein
VPASLRSNPPLRRLLAAWAQSCVGTGAGYVALLLLTLRHLHTSWALAAVLLADFLPSIVFGAWFGALADRYPKRRLLVAANLLQAGAFAGLALSDTAVPILALALLAGTGSALERPAVRASLPVLAGDAGQVAAALYDTSRWVGMTAGPLAAAALFALGGVEVPLALNGASFLIAAGVMATVAIARPAEAGTSTVVDISGLRGGLAAAFAEPAVGLIVACSAASFIAGGLLNVCEPLFATRVLGGSSSDYALLVACYCVGMVGASAQVARRGTQPAEVLARRYIAALWLIAAGIGGSALATNIPTALFTFAATGIGNALLMVTATQFILLRVPNALQGRLFGAKDTVEGACFLAGLAIAAAVVAGAGVRPALATGAGVCAACAIVALVALRNRITEPVPTLGSAVVVSAEAGAADGGDSGS